MQMLNKKFAIQKMLSIAFCILSTTNFCQAQIVTGQAYIENGNTAKAESDARREAMRTFVERQCGVKVNSFSQMENFVLVRDRVVTQSEGYVVVKKVISSKASGDYYTVVMDLEAGNKPIELVANDIKGYINSLDENSNRNGIDIALTGENPNETDWWNKVLVEKLKLQGFKTFVNDDIVRIQQINSSAANSYEIRRIGREQQSGAKAIIRGKVGLVRKAELVDKKTYRAIAQISCEIIGYESNAVDAVARYYTAVADDPFLAERRAQEQVILEASEELAKQASVTSQQETRGGTLNVKTMLSFSGIANRGVERGTILKAIQGAECSVIRSGFVANGDFQVFLSSSSYANLEELKSAILDQINASYPNAYDQRNENAMGSVSYTIKLRG